MFNPYGGEEDHGWNFRFKTAPGLEEMTFSVHGEVVGMWFNGIRIHPKSYGLYLKRPTGGNTVSNSTKRRRGLDRWPLPSAQR